ncbi:MAG: hypothetical protein LBK82_15015 [Planctomycetaceae bacterium]|nr:hypothetical protein [Planctomycetaceae bacterium]
MIPKRKATQFAVVNLIHSRLTPTRCFSKTSPTFDQSPSYLWRGANLILSQIL